MGRGSVLLRLSVRRLAASRNAPLVASIAFRNGTGDLLIGQQNLWSHSTSSVMMVSFGPVFSAKVRRWNE